MLKSSVFQSSGMWCRVGWVGYDILTDYIGFIFGIQQFICFFWTVWPLKMKAQQSFKTVEATHPMTQHHILEDLNFPKCNCKNFRFHITESCLQNQQIKGQWKISAANQISGWIRARWRIGTPDSWHSRDSKSCTGRPQPGGLQYFEQFVCGVSQQFAWHWLSVTAAWDTWHFGNIVWYEAQVCWLICNWTVRLKVCAVTVWATLCNPVYTNVILIYI